MGIPTQIISIESSFGTRETGAKFWFCKGNKSRLTTALGKPDRLWEMASGDSCQAFHFPFNF